MSIYHYLPLLALSRFVHRPSSRNVSLIVYHDSIKWLIEHRVKTRKDEDLVILAN